NLDRHADARILVNTTPVGMYPGNGAAALSLEHFPRLEGVLDLIYNPARTALILDAMARGVPALGGLTMLVEQARAAAERFTETQIDPACSEDIRRSLQNDTENIILIGMPGSGKTTLGQMIAEQTGRRFADSDDRIVERAGMSIPEYFSTHSEAEFRALETACIAELGKQSGLVIATGGGCVTRPENLNLLRQNGRIFFIQRDLDRLPTDGRPLSQANPLEALYQKRLPLYRSFADAEIDNNGAPETAAARILEVYHETVGR
ncbi:MAG: shikimate kinase, partial [Aristaeellaceae bacterium]